MSMRALRGVLSRSASLSVLDQLASAGGGFLTLAVAGRALSAQEFGALVVAVIFLNVLLGVHGALVTTPLSLEAGGKAGDSQLERYIAGAARLHLVQAAVFSIVASTIGLYAPLSDSWRTVALAVAIIQVPYQAHDFVRRLLLSRHEFGELLRFDALSSTLRVSALVASLVFGVRTAVGVAVVVGLGFLAGVMLGAAREPIRRLFGRRIEVASASLREVLVRHWPLTRLMLPETAAYQVATQCFVLAATGVLTSTEVAVLGGTQAIANAVNVVLIGLTNHGFAMMVRSSRAGEGQEWGTAARRLVLTVGAVSTATALIFVCLPGSLLRLAFGPASYLAESAPILRMFGLIVLLRSAVVVLVAMLRSIGQQRSVTLASAATAIVAAAATYPVLQAFGLHGAVWGLALSHALLAIGLGSTLRRFVTEGSLGKQAQAKALIAAQRADHRGGASA